MYFYILNGQQFGPVNPEKIQELIQQGVLSKDALIWAEGFPQWLPIAQVSAFQALVQQPTMPPVPPAPPVNLTTQPTTPIKVTSPYSLNSILYRIFLFLVIGVAVFLLFTAGAEIYLNYYPEKEPFSVFQSATTPAEITTPIQYEIEASNPSRFLVFQNTDSESALIGRNLTLTGQVYNEANVATYYNVIIEATFYDGDDNILGTTREPIVGLIPSGRYISYEIKTKRPKFTNHFRMSIVSADSIKPD